MPDFVRIEQSGAGTVDRLTVVDRNEIAACYTVRDDSNKWHCEVILVSGARIKIGVEYEEQAEWVCDGLTRTGKYQNSGSERIVLETITSAPRSR